MCDAGSGHFDLCDSTIDYIGLFIEKAWQQRGEQLRRLVPSDGWRFGCPVGSDWEGEPITAFPKEQPAPWTAYKGDPHTAFWYIDEEMARLTAAHYAASDGKEGGAAAIRELDLRSLTVGDTFTLESGMAYLYISGPVRKLTETTFEIVPYDCGADNPKRSHTAWLAAVREGDKTHKRWVQPIHITLK